ncbi:amino acid/amide ABC transporter membrane protein 2, HAAT family [Tistlia consotensis]|uniref:Amino acid/amide ABC transporter membrane protein 2, HAAT family n=1 Tax=Tistlia consotensis USBA 355 TaxID=560819 RepID=A0A1Y6BJM1_9PROT|nr:branched-chain amino acid ABC transporter permease [Tistlia consotensis]SMF04487.1 amino acid/amide ABC transporter membrane protein 2, HAAT family [Tistlia consotensis USBA 355]SNR54513.1 amino acid/amide ABC transporter membrane protein 2, HAAT family [Tistlia consotensis]
MRTGHYVESYEKQLALTTNPVTWAWTGALLLGLALFPLLVGNYLLSVAITVGIAAIGAIGLNLLTGITGLISLGQAGFLAAGCYTTALLVADYGWPPELALLAAGFVSALLSLVIGVPSLRLKGLYLAITTLAFSFIITHFLLYAEALTHGPYGVRVENLRFLGLDLTQLDQLFWLVLAVLVLTVLAALNLLRTRVGRAFTAIRDHDVAARVMGISLTRYKLAAFMVSSFVVGIAGGLMAFQFRFINVDLFNLLISIEALAMIIVGGLGSVAGSILGAVFIVLLPEAVRALTDLLPAALTEMLSTYVYEVRGLLTGLAIIVMLRIEPHGLIGLWRDAKRYWTHWPLSV